MELSTKFEAAVKTTPQFGVVRNPVVVTTLARPPVSLREFDPSAAT